MLDKTAMEKEKQNNGRLSGAVWGFRHRGKVNDVSEEEWKRKEELYSKEDIHY